VRDNRSNTCPAGERNAGSGLEGNSSGTELDGVSRFMNAQGKSLPDPCLGIWNPTEFGVGVVLAGCAPVGDTNSGLRARQNPCNHGKGNFRRALGNVFPALSAVRANMRAHPTPLPRSEQPRGFLAGGDCTAGRIGYPVQKSVGVGDTGASLLRTTLRTTIRKGSPHLLCFVILESICILARLTAWNKMWLNRFNSV